MIEKTTTRSYCALQNWKNLLHSLLSGLPSLLLSRSIASPAPCMSLRSTTLNRLASAIPQYARYSTRAPLSTASHVKMAPTSTTSSSDASPPTRPIVISGPSGRLHPAALSACTTLRLHLSNQARVSLHSSKNCSTSTQTNLDSVCRVSTCSNFTPSSQHVS